MKIILLSGGSGKRLWPLSNDQRSKQFIRLLRRDNILESMVQRVWRQLDELGLSNNTFIATGNSQKSILKSQLGIPDNQIITEPSRRDTFPAIALSTTYLRSVVGVSGNETIVVLPVDPYVDKAFFNKLQLLDNALTQEKATLGLIGIEPTFPSEKYGYIVPETKIGHKVLKFQEKPSSADAKDLISAGAVWNAGVFAFKVETMINLLEEMGVNTDFDGLKNNYEFLPQTSFDYEFTEKQDNIIFLRYHGYWKDLGTWNTLTEEMGSDCVGYTTELIDSLNTKVINESRLPIAVIGVKDLVIVAGSEGLFVSSKDQSSRIKELSNNFFNSVNYIEESWGKRYTLDENEKSSVFRYNLLDGKKLCIDIKQNQSIQRLSGKGEISVNGYSYIVTGIKDFVFTVTTEEKLD